MSTIREDDGGEDDEDDDGGDGAVAAAVKMDDGLVEVATIDEGHFGERALLPNKKYLSSCIAVSGDVKCATISRETFERVLGPLQAIVEQAQRKRDAEAEAHRRMLEAQGLHNCGVRSFGLDGVAHRLPSGGAMLRVTHHTTQKQYSLRLESKARLARRASVDDDDGGSGGDSGEGGALRAASAIEAIKDEIELLKQVWERDQARAKSGTGSEPLPGLLHAFATDGMLCLLLSVRLAGSLGELAPLWSWGVPKKDGMGLTELIWSVACVTSALERLHAQRLLVRSIATARLYVDDAGYVRILDVANAKHLEVGVERTFTLCGTPEFMAPEEVGGEGHGFRAIGGPSAA